MSKTKENRINRTIMFILQQKNHRISFLNFMTKQMLLSNLLQLDNS